MEAPMRMTARVLLGAGLFLAARLSVAQAPWPTPVPSMTVEEYEPKSTLVVPGHEIKRAKYPFIDVHNHQDTDLSAEAVAKLVADMDAMNMRVMVNLSGGQGETFVRGLKNLKERYPKRFVVFANLDFTGIGEPGWGDRAAAQLERDVKNGAQGLKIFKNFGMNVKDRDGRRVPVDDPRVDPVWEKCGALGIPVLIHTAEPASFFQPQDKSNERWLELKQFPRRARPPSEYPSWETLIGEQHHLFQKHPKTKFIDAHLGWLGGDLGRLGQLLDRLPNVYTEIGAVLAELGRQPRFARDWFIRHQDRVMFGKDIWAPEEYRVYFRVLETSDEYFDYYRKRHAFWKMYGLDLPDEVLKKLYYKNALRVVPGIDPADFPN
jgi:predicted TIM-barrel fold metal-dependent hydrolase